jgi:hypothetical protein
MRGWLELYTRVNESEDSLEAPLEFVPVAIGRSCDKGIWSAGTPNCLLPGVGKFK